MPSVRSIVLPLAPGPGASRGALAPLVLLLLVALLSGVLVAVSAAPTAAAGGDPAAASPPPDRKGPIGWEAYRRLDRIGEVPVGVSARQFSSFDRAGGNDDGFTGAYSCLRTDPAGCLLAEHDGPGQISSIWFTRDNGNVTATGRLKVELDGELVLDASLQAIVNGQLGAPFVSPLVANAEQASGGVYIKVPMPYTRSMRVWTERNPRFFHIAHSAFADAVGVTRFNPADRAEDVVALLRAAGTRDPKPANPRASTRPATFDLAPGASTTLAEATGPGTVSQLRVALPQTAAALSELSAESAPEPGVASSTLALPVDPGSDAVRVVRTADGDTPPQQAEVLVDGQEPARFAPPVAVAGSPTGEYTQLLDLPQDVPLQRSEVVLSDVLTAPGTTLTVESRQDGEVTASREVAAATPVTAAASPVTAETHRLVRGLRLRVTVDGRRTVDAPFAEFFGSGLGEFRVASLMTAVQPGGWHSSWWPMPYASSARVELYNGSDVAVRGGTAETTTHPDGPAGPARFHATSRAGSTVAGQDWTLLDVTGSGKVVGISQTMTGTRPGLRFLEGDERVYVDGARTPAIHGTGTEDLYEGGWYWNRGPYTNPQVGMTAHLSGAPGCSFECVAAYRTYVTDAVPFAASMRFGVEAGPDNDVPAVYGSTAYWYGHSDVELRRTRALDIGDSGSEAQAALSTVGGRALERLTSVFEGDDDDKPVTDTGRSATGATSFTLPVDPSNAGVALRRMTDQSTGRQAARVVVNGTAAGVWRTSAANPHQRWLDDDFLLPAALTAGRGEISVQLVPLAGSTPWHAARYETLSRVPGGGSSAPPGPVVGLAASGTGGGSRTLSWRAPLTGGLPVAHYEVFAAAQPGFSPSAATRVGTSRTTSFVRPTGAAVEHYLVRAVDVAGRPGGVAGSVTAVASFHLLSEGESMLPAISASAPVSVQSMTAFGPGWSGGRQLWLRAAAPGASVVLPFDVPVSGGYSIAAALTQAADYGRVQLAIDGRPLGAVVDGFSPVVRSTGPRQLGDLALTAGRHTLTMTVVGRSQPSSGFFAGLDYLRLTPAIPAAHARLGGSGGFLGAPVGNEVTLLGGNLTLPGGRVQNYAGGAIYWSPASQAHVVYGALLQRYRAMNGPARMGFPVADEEGVPGGRVSRFQAGHLVWSPGTGAQLVEGAILSHWLSLGGAGGRVGLPLADEEGVPGGRVSRFRNGRIFWSAQTGARHVEGAILDTYLRAGGPGGKLGFPLGDEEAVPGGRVSRFQRGHVYWSPATGAQIVEGAILGHYLALGGPARVGFPLAGEEGIPGGRVSRFARGHVLWSPGTGARLVEGAILARFIRDGGVGRFGYPLTDEYAVPEGRASRFQYAVIVWNSRTGATRIDR
jgi:hypothetical protein